MLRDECKNRELFCEIEFGIIVNSHSMLMVYRSKSPTPGYFRFLDQSKTTSGILIINPH